MTAKEYLNQAYKLDREAEMLLQKAESMRKSLYGRGQCIEGRSTGTDKDSIGKTIAKVIDYERQADELIDRLVGIRVGIENAVREVPDPVQREVLERKYLLYQSWDSIARAMNYSERHIRRLHSRALEKIKDVLECQ